MKDLFPGVIFALIGLVVLDGLGRIISSSADLAQTSINLKVAQKQKQINELLGEEQKSNVQAIGFTVSDPEEEDYYDE